MLSLALTLLLAAYGSATGAPSLADPTAADSTLAARADTTRKAVAVLYFDNNTGSAEYDGVGKGMAAMMITDLAAVPQLRVVEREHLSSVLGEMELQHSKYFDPETAVKAGRLVGAEYILAGSMTSLRRDIRIDTRVIRVETGEIVKAAKVTGKEDKFFDLQQKLARELVNGLPIALSPEDSRNLQERQETNRIDSLSTVTNYSRAVSSFDAGDYVGALEQMQPVVRAAPNSILVQLTYNEMKRRAARGARDKARDKAKAGLRGILRGIPD
jgi:TolB-like protein